jgi:hypothetical protein
MDAFPRTRATDRVWTRRGLREDVRRSPWGWEGTRECDVDGEQLVDWAGELRLVSEDVAAEGAVAERGDDPRSGHRVIRRAQGHRHARRAGPVISRMSAWRGEATMSNSKRCRSRSGLVTRPSSCSQPLQEPASTWRMPSQRFSAPRCRRARRRIACSWRRSTNISGPRRRSRARSSLLMSVKSGSRFPAVACASAGQLA